VLLNLSRDQLDRNNEVRRLSATWRDTLARRPDTATASGTGANPAATLGAAAPPHVVANADDPLVVWAAQAADSVTWVGAGQRWTADAAGCPNCGGRIHFPDPSGSGSGGWACSRCHLTRPPLDVWLEGGEVVTADGGRLALHLALPGRCNQANAAMAMCAADRMGVDRGEALAAMAETAEVAGRYRTVRVGPTSARLLLAKNPAGWLETFDLLAPPPTPVVVAINAHIADGKDPSWLWDVPFERLQGRLVVATGERSADLAVRLGYADVEHRRQPDPLLAIAEAGATAAGASVDVVANYTSFQAITNRLGHAA
jgi:UDP-N-acetylmuramyl tripeptide synthase